MSHIDEQLNDWCCSTGRFSTATGDAPWDEDALVSCLEVLFMQRCEAFIQERLEYGFSESTYRPISGTRIRVVNGSFGAKAYLSEGVDCIDVSRSTLSFLLWLALKFASVSEIREAGKSVKRRKEGARTAESLYGSFDIPSSPLLRALAIHVAFAGFLYILFHELGHLSQGHCRLLADSSFCDFSLEIDDGGGSAESTPQHRSMELMADLFATRELAIYAQYKRHMAEVEEGPCNAFTLVEMGCHNGHELTDVWAHGGIALTFYLTSSSSLRHPSREMRFLTSLLASRIFNPSGPNVMNSEQMQNVCKVVNLVAEVAEAAISPGEVFTPLTAPIVDAQQRRRFEDEMLGLIKSFEELKSSLRSFSRAEKAFLDFMFQAENPGESKGG